MNRLPRINIRTPQGYKSQDFLSLIKKKMPKDSLRIENGFIRFCVYKLGIFQKFDKTFMAWGMRSGDNIEIFVEELK